MTATGGLLATVEMPNISRKVYNRRNAASSESPRTAGVQHQQRHQWEQGRKQQQSRKKGWKDQWRQEQQGCSISRDTNESRAESSNRVARKVGKTSGRMDIISSRTSATAKTLATSVLQKHKHQYDISISSVVRLGQRRKGPLSSTPPLGRLTTAWSRAGYAP
jgi:hypothetical protein